MCKKLYFLLPVNRIAIALKTIIVMFFLGVCSTVHANVSVNITIEQPQFHYAQIKIKYDEFSHNNVNFHLPTWRTGRYEILNLANGIRDFSARDEKGNPLKWKKTDKDTWQVLGTLHKKIEISYQVYANQLGKRTRHIDDSHAFIDASAVVMYNDSIRNQKHHISLDVPSEWRSVSGLKPGSFPHQFIAENYDVLVDSPIETGINEHHEFSVDGLDYELVIWGKGNYDSAKILADLKVLVQQSKHIWQGYPFERYVFMVHATSGARGATEHLNSTIIQRSRFEFSDRQDYLGFIATAAHEFVHTWNVKQYRPKGLVPYNYQQENYSPLLWLSEGSTSYLQNQLLLRGNLMSSDEFLENIAKRITGYIHKPGRKSQTVAEASFDKWLEEGGNYDKNHSVNIYSEGFLVSWLLDFSIIEKTKLEKSYRDVHNALYQQYKIPKGFDEADLLTILKDVTGDDYQGWWQNNVHDYAKVDFDKLLTKAGLTMSYGNKKNNRKLAWTGLKTKPSENGLKVSSIEKNSPAWQANLMLDDIIVAINGLRMADKDLNTRLKNFNPEDEISVTFFRRDELSTRKLVLGSKPKSKLKIVPVKSVSKHQKAFFKQWTGLDFPNS
jgi:predicted metalloprotease with PDZ domain